MTRPIAAVLAALSFALALPAQEMPKPAPQLQKLQPLLGNWHGSGVMDEPSGAKTKWTARGTYQMALGGFFVREDFEIRFEGMDVPMLKHGYLGWDAQNQRYVHLMVSSNGDVELLPMAMGADGSMTTVSLREQAGMQYAIRSVFTAKGDKLGHQVTALMPAGPSMDIVHSEFQRGGDGFQGARDQQAFTGGKPHADVARLSRSAGLYEVKGAMKMGPAMPAMKIVGTDDVTAEYGGMVVHVHTLGEAEGMPGQYVGDVFWGYDGRAKCLVGAYVSNMGEVMAMEARWSPDGKLLATSHALWGGQPMVQRMTMEFDAQGASTKATNHSIMGTEPPFESFAATYTKKK